MIVIVLIIKTESLRYKNKIKRLEDAIIKGREYLESGKHVHWQEFRRKEDLKGYMNKIMMLFFLLILCSLNTAHADVYKYKDDQGMICEVDQVSKVPEKYRNQIPYEAWKKGISQEFADKDKQENLAQGVKHSQQKVEIFVTSWCPYCHGCWHT